MLVSPTGSGKSLCFQIPAVMGRGTTWVFEPLKALMTDQVARLLSLKVPATYINSNLSREEKDIRRDLLSRGLLKLFYLAPERLDEGHVDEAEVERMLKLRPSRLVVDEAHSIDRWGDDFRPAYARLGEFRRALGSPPTYAFTATASLVTRKRILQSLDLTGARVFVRDVDRPNIGLFRYRVSGDTAKAQIIEGPATVSGFHGFPDDGLRADEKSRELPPGSPSCCLPTEFFHAMARDANWRENVQQQFTGRLQPELRRIICTNAFGMGVDIADVRLAVHWQAPSAPADYLQEFGRVGRDGGPSVAVLLWDPADRGLNVYMAEKTVEEAVGTGRTAESEAGELLARKERAITQMYELAGASGCFRDHLMSHFGERREVRRRSLIDWLLSWLFVRIERVNPGRVCCDSCSGHDLMSFVRMQLGGGRGER